MRTSILIFLAAFLLPIPSAVAYPAVPDAVTYDALVVLQVDGLDDAQLERLAAQVGRHPDHALEYACTWSGVVVLKMNGIDVADRADVITLARRLLGSADIIRGVEVLHVHMAPSGTGKC